MFRAVDSVNVIFAPPLPRVVPSRHLRLSVGLALGRWPSCGRAGCRAYALAAAARPRAGCRQPCQTCYTIPHATHGSKPVVQVRPSPLTVHCPLLSKGRTGGWVPTVSTLRPSKPAAYRTLLAARHGKYVSMYVACKPTQAPPAGWLSQRTCSRSRSPLALLPRAGGVSPTTPTPQTG